MTFQRIKDIQTDYNNGLSWSDLLDYFVDLSGRDIQEILNTSILEICQFKSYFIKEIELINKVELIELSHEANEDEEGAGLDRFSMYGYYPQFRELANNDVTKIEEVGKLKYKHCFTELSYRKRLSDYQKDLQRIKDIKNKQR